MKSALIFSTPWVHRREAKLQITASDTVGLPTAFCGLVVARNLWDVVPSDYGKKMASGVSLPNTIPTRLS